MKTTRPNTAVGRRKKFFATTLPGLWSASSSWKLSCFFCKPNIRRSALPIVLLFLFLAIFSASFTYSPGPEDQQRHRPGL